jgi:protein-disulfide isomerase
LKEEQFARDLDADDVKEKVQNDYQSGLDSHVNSTPTFFLNGEKISNPRSYDELKSLLDSAVAKNF